MSELGEEKSDSQPERNKAEDVGAPEKEIGEILSKLPQDTPPDVIEAIAQLDYSGPLPLPAMMREYENITPGLADRIMKLAENEQQIRKRDHGRILFNDGIRVFGSVLVSLCLIAAGVYCGIIGEPWLGGVLGTSGAVAGIIKTLLKRDSIP